MSATLVTSTEAEATIARVMPGTRLRVSPQSRGLLVSGQVGSAGAAAEREQRSYEQAPVHVRNAGSFSARGTKRKATPLLQ